MSALLFLTPLLWTACSKPCPEGFGKTADGVCMPLAGYGTDDTSGGTDSGADTSTDSAADTDTDTDSDTDADADTDTDTDTDADTDTDTDTDADTDTDTDVDTGASTARFSGQIAYRGKRTLSVKAFCIIALWDESTLTDGFPDPTRGSAIGQATVDCPLKANTPIGYEADIPLTGATRAGAFLSVDLDGDPSTTTDIAAGAYFKNPFDVAPDGDYPGINLDAY